VGLFQAEMVGSKEVTSMILIQKTIEPLPFVAGQPDWIFWVFLSMAILFAWIQVFSGTHVLRILFAMFSLNQLNQLIKEGFQFKNRVTPGWLYIYVASIGMLLYQGIQFFIPQNNLLFQGFGLFVILAALVVAFWLIKVILIMILGFIFRTMPTTKLFLLNIFDSVALLGGILFPLLIVTVYLKSEMLWFVCLGFVFLASLFRLIKGLRIGLSLRKFPSFFLFVYLCTLEILPVLVLGKLVFGYL
jgi:hypothetical protein